MQSGVVREVRSGQLHQRRRWPDCSDSSDPTAVFDGSQECRVVLSVRCGVGSFISAEDGQIAETVVTLLRFATGVRSAEWCCP